MFDDPNKELRRLQERLLAMEQEPEEPSDRPETPEEALESVKVLLEQEPIPEEPKPISPEEARRKRIGMLVILLLLELAVLCAGIGWWLTWK